jgi:hypothetical protein
MSQLLEWIEQNKEKLDWGNLFNNPAAIHLITEKQNIDKINWDWLSGNECPEAIHLLNENIDKINWERLSSNPSIFKDINENEYILK